MNGDFEGNLQFLTFLADISDPGTGEIVSARLGRWLGLSAEELRQRWEASGREAWNDYADDVLRVLDRIQDRTHSLPRTLSWYRYEPIALGTEMTADQLVSVGRACDALHWLRNAAAPTHGHSASPGAAGGEQSTSN